MTDTAHAIGARAARNTAWRAAGELIGKLATLVVYALLAREGGESEVGVLVLALALCQIATLPVDVGIDRVMVRQIVAEPSTWNDRFAEVLGVKAVLAVPSLVVTIAISFAYEPVVQRSILILLVAFLLESLMRTLHSAFTAFERSDLLARCIVIQRLAAAALGVAAIAAGWGVVGVSAAYLAGVLAGLGWSELLLRRHVAPPRWRPHLRNWRARARLSLPFAAQDVFTVLLFKLDAVMLSILTTEAIVGRYGSAYRLLESTFFITVSLAGAFAPMFTYLHPTGTPSLGRAFSSSIKLALVLLAPIAVAFACLAEPICRLFFGPDFVASAASLRILAPVVVMLGIVSLASAFVVSRNRPQGIVRAGGAMVALNLALNVALIPAWDAAGAAAAMLITEVVFAAIVLRFVRSALDDPLPWRRTLAGPGLATAAMIAATVALADSFPLALAVGTAVYGLVFVAVERITAPADLAFALDLVRRRGVGLAR